MYLKKKNRELIKGTFLEHPLYDMKMDSSQPEQMHFDVRQIRRVMPHQEQFHHLSKEVYFVLYQSSFGMFALRIVIRNSFL